ncbi:MAG: bifunctional phosphoribosylaminoimidazolecarboxamide formyltransferase/inosine monophosphate cyclohydrolase [Robiginitomaculum sp.]|nr:MAG: bifunctional phosphoribosylaminoimidazolecarboxamide formyltransferase/inosine monophosphate cyclohydrolase [Robiginitomaculum sp.]
MIRIKRALLSVSDKTDIVEQARQLVAMGVELVSTGGTAKTLSAAGLPVRDAAELTGFPEMMQGRVKTLHPNIHGGLLARRDQPDHISSMQQHGIEPIDLLVVNLYPFEQTRDSGADFATCIENIDIGGPAMLRAAAKNHAFVAVCTDSEDVQQVLTEMETNDGQVSAKLRAWLAAKTYSRTAHYDAAISNWFQAQIGETSPKYRSFSGVLQEELRYGENPHQKAAIYRTGANQPGVTNAQQVQGKAISYNNLNDTHAAFELVAEFPADKQAAIAIIKHANPCGVAVATQQIAAWNAALACDPVSAFGGVIAANRKIDLETADAICKLFVEVIIAPSASEAALKRLAKKKNVRVLLTGAMPDPSRPGLEVKSLTGGLLVQTRDNGQIEDLSGFQCVTKTKPTEQQLADLAFAWKVAKHVKSNTIVYAKGGSTAGIGAGQMSRIDAARIATQKAEQAAVLAKWPHPRTQGSVAASDAFFPFADGLLEVIEAGAVAVVQPGGSIRDDEVIAAADAAGIAMVFTGMRHFRH